MNAEGAILWNIGLPLRSYPVITVIVATLATISINLPNVISIGIIEDTMTEVTPVATASQIENESLNLSMNPLRSAIIFCDTFPIPPTFASAS